MNYEVICIEGDIATIEMSIEHLNILEQLVDKINIEQRKSEQKFDIDSRRRIIPYFMNQFYSYAKKEGHKYAIKYLKKVKESKKSKQKKFELCDIQDLFKDRKNIQTQQLWIKFLKESPIIMNKDNNISKNRELYLSYVQILLMEASKQEYAYHKFLSGKMNIKQEQINYEENITYTQSYYIEPYTQATDQYIQSESEVVNYGSLDPEPY